MDMKSSGMVNVGQFICEEYGLKYVYVVGFGIYYGMVIVFDSWGNFQQELIVFLVIEGSWEDIIY